MNKVLFLIFAIACFSAGCKKNKPLLSFSSQNKRLVGEWKLEEISSSGKGINSQLSSGSTTEFYKPTVLKLNIDQTASMDGYMLRTDVDTVSHQSVTGSWSATGEDLTLTWDGDMVYNPQIQKYQIEFLSKKEMKINYKRGNVAGSASGVINDFTFFYKFKK